MSISFRNQSFWRFIVNTLIVCIFFSCKSTHQIVELTDDSSWCWFQDERAIIDGDLLVYSGVTSEGANIVSSYHLKTGEKTTFVLNNKDLPPDDHNVGVLMIRPDGRYLTVYGGHGVDQLMRYRISDSPSDITSWGSERTFDVGARLTYSNVYRLDKTGVTYNFHRGIDRNPNYLVSSDDGNTWTYGGRLFTFTGRPYLRYASDGENRIHFTTTEEHPRHYNNSIYHGYMEDGNVYRTDGKRIGELSTTSESNLSPEDFTKVYAADKDVRANVAWTSDIQLDKGGKPYMVFSVTKDPIELGETKNTEKGGFDHRYHYAYWDGKQWQEREIAYAGTRLYPGENEYTGLITLHPNNPHIVYLSADVHPETGEPLLVNGEQRREIFRGTTDDNGTTWRWEAITKDSVQDNIRPIVLDYKGREVVIWLAGRYTTYKDYDLKVMGWLPE